MSCSLGPRGATFSTPAPPEFLLRKRLTSPAAFPAAFEEDGLYGSSKTLCLTKIYALMQALRHNCVKMA